MSDIPPLVLVRGPEELLADRAVVAVLADLKVEAPDLDVVRVGPDYHSGQLVMDTSPSLFGGSTCVVIEALHEASEDLHADLLDYLAAPAEHVTLVVRHAGGPRGKKVLDALVAGKARIFECPAVKSDRDKSDFVTNEFRRAGRKVTPEAVRALVEAVGGDLRELAASCAQLVVDTEGSSTTGSSRPTTGARSRPPASGSPMQPWQARRGGAAAAPGTRSPPGSTRSRSSRSSQASSGRWCGSARRRGGQLGGPGELARYGALAGRQGPPARPGWTPEGLATSIQAVAAADAEVKGGGRDPVTRWSGPSSPSPRPGPQGGADAGRPIERRAARAACGSTSAWNSCVRVRRTQWSRPRAPRRGPAGRPPTAAPPPRRRARSRRRCR